MALISLFNPLYQSGYTYLQAAGSDGSDKTVTGLHLKWDFLRLLGERHLPKGNYTSAAPYTSTQNFNRTGDFVRIYRYKYAGTEFNVTLNTTTAPTNKVQVDGKWNWVYVNLPVSGMSTLSTTVRLIFNDTPMYNAIAAAMSPLTDHGEFIKRYPGIMELHTDDKLAFFYDIDADFTKFGGYVRTEVIGTPDSLDPDTKQLNVRKKFTSGAIQLYSENSKFLRFDSTAYIQSIKLITYQDYITGVNGDPRGDGNWTEVRTPDNKDFSLTTATSEMTERFQSAYVNGKWPKFNEANIVTGQSTVNYANYLDRWQRPGYTFSQTNESGNDTLGLRHFIHTYMKRSTTDPKGIITLPSDNPEDENAQVISTLDFLKLLSLDFHLSRIMGMGHIDKNAENYKYVYCLEYVTGAALDKAPYTTTGTRTHLYMTLPTDNTDYRLPKAPKLDDLTFGASIDNGTNEPSLLTDINGYAPQENVRFININRAPYNHERAFGPFYYDPTEFILANESQPVAYGLEYKELGETSYRIPEINHDADYLDASGKPETVSILENGGPRLFTHQEEEEGTHVYAAYAINWFSRVSPLSNTRQVATVFPKIARLLPPFSYSTHLIQDEDPAEEAISDKTLILTTPAEQGLLAAIPGTNDQTLVRTTFDWNHVHNNAHPTVDYAEFFFREDEPLVVKGKVLSVVLEDAQTAIVSTGSYQVTSSFPAETIQPVIASGDVTKFQGSLFSSGQSHYIIENITVSGSNPKFRIKALKQNQAVAPDPANQNQFFSQESIELPQAGDLFFVIENMGQPSNWDLKHTDRVYIEKHYSNAQVGLRYSPTNIVTYGVRSVEESDPDTILTLHEPIRNDAVEAVEYSVRSRIVDLNPLKIEGNHVADLTSGTTLRILGHLYNDGVYTTSMPATYDAVNDRTIIDLVTQPTDVARIEGVVDFTAIRSVDSVDFSGNTITIHGLRASEINLAHIEYNVESDGSESRFVVGGILSEFSFEPLLDGLGNGTGYIQLFTDYELRPHPSLSVEWHKGMIRLTDVSGKKQVYPVTYIGNLTSTSWSSLTFVIQDPGFVAKDDYNPEDMYTLDMDVPQKGNLHPSYRTYLRKSNGVNPVTNAPLSSGVQFKEGFMLPETGNPLAGSKQTYMSSRSMDVKNNLFSYLSAPSTILAQKITVPMPPALPTGPLYATRPDFYGKSTYTFDTKVNTTNGRFPYAMVFSRCSNDSLLDVLYTKGRQQDIFQEWDLLPAGFRLDPNLWKILIDATPDPVNPDALKTHTTIEGSFTWPLPNNPKFYLPFDGTPASLSKPFAAPYELTDPWNFYGTNMNFPQVIQIAVQQAFTPMNEQPPLGAYIKEGKQTLPGATVLRDTNGNLLDPLTNDLYPMVRKFIGDDNETYLRFTDYNLDGASISIYFYRAMELDDKYKFSAPSPALGPVVMVNSFAPDKPQIRKAITRLQDEELEVSSAIVLELNDYSANEQISRLEIYRAIDELDALSVRTMEKVKTISWGDPVEDDFSDTPFPLYGETLYYRVVAIRVVKDITNTMISNTPIFVDVPSQPSEVVKTSLVDNVNPEAPELAFVIGDSTSLTYEDVVVIWSATCYNGTYSLQKMNNNGNWVEIYTVNQLSGVMTYEIPSLPAVDEDGNPIYHRFRVEVENSSGLFNLEHKEYMLEETELSQEDYGDIDLEDNSGDILV